MLWLKAFHIIAMTAWFAGLFYLPRLFVYHADSKDSISIERFKIMERRLFYGIMTPAAIITLLLGLSLLYGYAWQLYHQQLWLHIKLTLVILLFFYHGLCGKFIYDFKHDQNKHSAAFYRFFNEIPTLFLLAIVILAVVKPF